MVRRIHPKFLLDPYGNEIRVGKLVAYNYSGEIRIGKVLELEGIPKLELDSYTSINIRNPYKITVEEVSEKFKSIVRSPKNMVVING